MRQIHREPDLKPSRPRFTGYTDTFLTERQTTLFDLMLRTGSVKATCESMKISRPRYYELTADAIRKWKMAAATNNVMLGVYKQAKNQRNLLARHLTEVRRIVPSDTEVEGLPALTERMVPEEVPQEEIQS